MIPPPHFPACIDGRRRSPGPLAGILTLAVAMALAGCGPAPEELMARARGAIAAENYSGAKVDLAEALREQPDNPALLLLLVETQLRLRDVVGAKGTIERLRAVHASGAAFGRAEAETLLFDGKPADALARLGNDRTPDAWRIRAAAQLDSRNPGAALAAFRNAAAAGGSPLLLADFAHFLLSGNDVQAAAIQVQRLRALAPAGYATLMLLGTVEARHGRHAAALAHFSAAAERYPARVEPLLAQADMLEAMGRIGKAAAAVEKAGALDATHPGVVGGRLRIAAVQGQWAHVREQLQTREADLDPQSADGMLYAEALLSLGYAEQARTYFARTVLMQPGNLYARRMLARAQVAGKDAAGAVRTLEPVVDHDLFGPEEMRVLADAAAKAGVPQASAWRARLADPILAKRTRLMASGQQALERMDWAQACADFRALADLGVGNSYVWNSLSAASTRSGKPAEGLAAAERALAINADDPESLKAAARAHIALGQDAAVATAMLHKVLAQNPMDIEAVLLLDMLGAPADRRMQG